MAVTRRKFIKDGALLGMLAATPLAAFARGAAHCANAAAATNLLPADLNAPLPLRGEDSLAALSQDAFARQLNSRFELANVPDSAPLSLKLAGIQDFKSACGHAHTSHVTLESFTLKFSCDQPTELPQGTYTLEHPELGSFALFLVPSANTAGFDAVINRLHA